MRRFVEGPPLPSAYTTVTNGARFAPLHAAVIALFEDLAATYACDVHDTLARPETQRAIAHARTPITLIPSGAGAPLAVAFLSPIGVVLTCGWWYSDVSPSCSCDACDMTAASEAERMIGMCRAVVAGGFQEAIRTPLFGMAKQSHVFQMSSGSASGWSAVPRATARQRRGAGPSESAWKPWELRVRAASVGPPG